MAFRFRFRSWLPCVVLLLAACQTIRIKSPIAATGEIRVGTPARAFEAVSEREELAGLIVLFEGDTPGASLWVVRNPWHQDLGMIDSLGRAYRYLPHHKEAAWIGSGTIEEGTARILGVGQVTLIEVPFGEPEGPGTPGEREQNRADRVDASASGAPAEPEPSKAGS